jgi:hypothetical protein
LSAIDTIGCHSALAFGFAATNSNREIATCIIRSNYVCVTSMCANGGRHLWRRILIIIACLAKEI